MIVYRLIVRWPEGNTELIYEGNAPDVAVFYFLELTDRYKNEPKAEIELRKLTL